MPNFGAKRLKSKINLNYVWRSSLAVCSEDQTNNTENQSVGRVYVGIVGVNAGDM
jgi:hypothetical protein